MQRKQSKNLESMGLSDQLSQFLNKTQQFDYPVNGIDPIWQVLFEDPKGEWQYWSVSQYQQNFTIQSRVGEQGAIKWNSADDIIIWDDYNYEYTVEEADEGVLQI